MEFDALYQQILPPTPPHYWRLLRYEYEIEQRFPTFAGPPSKHFGTLPAYYRMFDKERRFASQLWHLLGLDFLSREELAELGHVQKLTQGQRKKLLAEHCKACQACANFTLTNPSAC